MRVQDRLDKVLEPHELRPADNLSPHCQGHRIRYPDLRQEAARIQLRQYRGIDRVGLDLGMCNHSHLLRIDDHDTVNMRGKQLSHRSRIARCTDDHMIVVGQILPDKILERFPSHRNPPALPESPIVECDSLRCYAVDIQPDGPHAALLVRLKTGSLQATRQLRIRARSASRLVAGAAR